MDLKDKKTENTLNARFYLYFCSEQLKIECMRLFQSSIFRALCSVVMGVLVIMYPVDITRWLVVAIGLMFLLSGIVSCVAYFYARKQAAKSAVSDSSLTDYVKSELPHYPVLGLGSLILGLILTLRPEAVVDIMAYILGAMLVLGGLNLIFNLIATTRIARVPVFFWICPCVVLLTGIVAIIKPDWIAGATMAVIGWCMLLYGVTEIINAVKFYNLRKAIENRQQ